MKKIFWIIIKLIRKLLGITVIGLNLLSFSVLFIGIASFNVDLMLIGALSGYTFSFPLIYVHTWSLLIDKPKYNPYLDINNDTTSIYSTYKYYGGRKTLEQFTNWLYRLNFNEVERLDEMEKFVIDSINGKIK